MRGLGTWIGAEITWVTVLAFVKDGPLLVSQVDSDAYDVITFGHTRNVDPLAGELFVIPVAPAGRDALICATVAIALAAIVFERVFETAMTVIAVALSLRMGHL